MLVPVHLCFDVFNPAVYFRSDFQKKVREDHFDGALKGSRQLERIDQRGVVDTSTPVVIGVVADCHEPNKVFYLQAGSSLKAMQLVGLEFFLPCRALLKGWLAVQLGFVAMCVWFLRHTF